MNPKISVIVPTYNAESYLMNAVNSVINQSFGFENIELILIDDNSNDGIMDILNDLSRKYENIKTIFLEENSGSPSKPRNIGIDNASCEYVMFLDNDDEYVEDFCKKMYDTIENHQCDIVTCRNYDVVKGEYQKYHSVLDKRPDFVKLNSIEEDPDLLSTTSMLIWNKIYKKSFLLEIGAKFPSGTLYEDVYFNLIAFMNASPIVYLNDYFGYIYNIRVDGDDKSTSQDFKEENLIKFYNGLNNIYNLLESENKHYSNFESEMLVGFTKWLVLTKSDDKLKLRFFKDFKKHYKRFSLFTRLEHIPLVFNIFINLGIKLMSLSDFTFKLVLKIAGLIFN